MSGIKKKIVWLPYDFDTAIGITNEGTLAFSYNLEDTDQTDSGADIYNGQQSVFWNNLRDTFGDELKAMYQSLRSSGAWSYDAIEEMFETHQAKWGEAIFNEDGYAKYIAPLVESGSGAYLAMLQGSKEEQRKWWLYNRYRYIDSKYNAGDALSDVIQLRGYAKSNIAITPYADIYATVKFGSYLVQTRASRNNSYTLVCPLDNVNDTEIYIYSASQLASVGDLSGLLVGFADFSLATKLQSLKLGDESSDYANGNLTELTLGNNTLLRVIDVRNCTALTQAVDLSGCTNIEAVYFAGTAVTGLELPNGGILKTLQLPSTVTNLTIRNQTVITSFVMPSYANITTLWLENVSDAVDSKAILKAIAASSRVRLVGFYWECDDADEISDLFDILDTMRGLDEYGNNMDTAQVSGTIHTSSLTGAEISDFNERYGYVTVTADHTTSYLYYYNYDGSELLYTETILDGADGTYTGTPSRAADSYATYTFAGWSTKMNATSADSSATKNVTADRNAYAAYTSTGKTYTVYFYNNSSGSNVLLETVTVFAGSTASYSGDTPTYGGDNPDDWQFSGWSPSNTNILANTSCYAQFNYIGIEDTITDTWAEILAAVADGTYSTKYSVGDTKLLDLGTEGVVAMQIVGFDKDPLADGSGYAPISWISEQLLGTSHRMNPALVTNYKWASGNGWGSYSNDSSTTSDFYVSNSNNVPAAGETATWTCTFTAAADFTIQVPSQSISNTGSGLAGDYEYSAVVNGTTIYQNVGGTVSVAVGTAVSVSSGDSVTITLTFKQDSAASVYNSTEGTADAYRYLTAYLRFMDADADRTSFAVVTGGTSNATVTISTNQIRTFDSYDEGTGSIGGWESSEMRTYLKNTVKPLIPETVRNAIKEVTKTQRTYNTAGNSAIQTTTDDVWIPNYEELFESTSLYYDMFQNTNANRIKSKAGASSASYWWLHRATSVNTFRIVATSGYGSDNYANGAYGVALGFCT